MDLGYLRLEGLVAQAPGARRPATAGASQVLGAILTPAPVSTLQIGQAQTPPSWSRCTGRSTGWALTLRRDRPADALFRIVLALRSSRTPFLKLLDPLRFVSGGAEPGALVDLGLLDPGAQSLGGGTPSSSPILRTAPLARAGSTSASNARPRGSLPQLIEVFSLSHNSDPSVSSLPPNPGRFRPPHNPRRCHESGGRVPTAPVERVASFRGQDPDQGL